MTKTTSKYDEKNEQKKENDSSIQKVFKVPTINIEDLEVKEDMDIVLQKWSYRKIVRNIAKGKIIVDKDFQRDEIYRTLQKSGIINSAISGIAIPAIHAYEERRPSGEIILSIIDGQQRIASIRGFMNDEYALKIPFGEYSVLNGLKYSDIKRINPDFADQIADITLDINIIRNIDKKQAQHYFGLINSTTSPLAPGEMLRSIPAPVGTIFKQIVENRNFRLHNLRKSRDGEYVIAVKALWNEMFNNPLHHEFVGNKIREFMHYFSTVEDVTHLQVAQKSLFELLEMYSNVVEKSRYSPRSQNDLYCSLCFLNIQRAKGNDDIEKLAKFFNWLYRGINKQIYPIRAKKQFDRLLDLRNTRHTTSKDFVLIYEELYKNEVALWLD